MGVIFFFVEMEGNIKYKKYSQISCNQIHPDYSFYAPLQKLFKVVFISPYFQGNSGIKRYVIGSQEVSNFKAPTSMPIAN